MTTTTITRINGAKDLNQYITETNQLIQRIREEFLSDIQQERATVALPQFLTNNSWNVRAQLCQSDHRSFIYKRTGLPQFSTFLQNEATLNEAVEQLEHLRRMIVTNKQQKKTGIRKIHDIIKLVKEQERQEQRIPSPTFDFVTTMNTDDTDDHDVLLEAEHSAIVKALKAQIETTKQNHRTISHNLLHQVHSIMKAVRHHIVDLKRSAEDNVGEIIHHAEKCRVFIEKCFDYSVLLYCASAWWRQTQKDAMDHGYYHLEVETVDPEESKFNPNLAAPTENNLRICVFRGNTIDPKYLVHVYDYDQDLARAIYTQETVCEAEKILRRFRTPGIVVATSDA
jgi:hypothetical protein